MNIDFRLTTPADAEGIGDVKIATWPDDGMDVAMIQAAFAAPQHATIVAIADTHIVGYLNCFMVESHGVQRWEHDELAVHPDYRRRGIAYELINRAYAIGCNNGHTLHHAWIQVDNVASQASFRRAGFKSVGNHHWLHICWEGAASDSNMSSTDHLLRVNTFAYAGYWLEGNVIPTDFAATRQYLLPAEIGLVGMMIPVERDDLVAAAQANGFHAINHFQQWQRT